MAHDLHVTFAVRSDSWNMEAWGYGNCWHCGCCSRDKKKRYESRIRLLEEHLKHWNEFNNWFDDLEGRALQEKNIQTNIKWVKRRLSYYNKKLDEMKGDSNGNVDV